MTESFHSNGKLLLSAEYAVLDGALSLAVPTVYGQSLSISENKSKQLHWLSKDHDDSIWFETHFDLHHLSTSKVTSKTGEILRDILIAAQGLNPDFLRDDKGYTASSSIDFPRNWGLGTSSTLINNIANWAQVNAYELLKKTFGGSGYDIACAQ
ncbi:MAG: GHMP kinase, partial [Eudoraea sp.]|nr:GHMP kinase [Eudoraea sp.]